MSFFDNLFSGLNFTHKIASTQAMKEYVSAYIPYPQCKQHDLYSDLYWKCLAMHASTTVYHPTGTCKMGPRSDPTAVVDPQLR